jgi:hypothetical protein
MAQTLNCNNCINCKRPYYCTSTAITASPFRGSSAVQYFTNWNMARLNGTETLLVTFWTIKAFQIVCPFAGDPSALRRPAAQLVEHQENICARKCVRYNDSQVQRKSFVKPAKYSGFRDHQRRVNLQVAKHCGPAAPSSPLGPTASFANRQSSNHHHSPKNTC